jgi:hypothetical protein
MILILLLILLVVTIIGCFLVGTGKILLVAGMIIFSTGSIPVLMIGLSHKEIVPVCFGLAFASIGMGCTIWLQYLCQAN